MVLVLTCRAHLNPTIDDLLPVRRALRCGGALLACESPAPEEALAGAANFAFFEPGASKDVRRRMEMGSMNAEQRMAARSQLEAGGTWREHAGAGGRDAAQVLANSIMNGAGGFATDGWRIASSEWRDDRIVWSTRRRIMFGVALQAHLIGLDSPVEHGSSGKEIVAAVVVDGLLSCFDDADVAADEDMTGTSGASTVAVAHTTAIRRSGRSKRSRASPSRDD